MFSQAKFGAPLIIVRANTVLLPRANLDPQAEMSPRVGWNRLWWGCFGFNCAQMAQGEAESNFGLQGWVGTLGLKQFFVIFSVWKVGSPRVALGRRVTILPGTIFLHTNGALHSNYQCKCYSWNLLRFLIQITSKLDATNYCHYSFKIFLQFWLA